MWLSKIYTIKLHFKTQVVQRKLELKELKLQMHKTMIKTLVGRNTCIQYELKSVYRKGGQTHRKLKVHIKTHHVDPPFPMHSDGSHLSG